MKFGTHIHVSLRINCDDYGDPLTFHLASSSGQNFSLSNTLVYDQMLAKLRTFPQASPVKLTAVMRLCCRLTNNNQTDKKKFSVYDMLDSIRIFLFMSKHYKVMAEPCRWLSRNDNKLFFLIWLLLSIISYDFIKDFEKYQKYLLDKNHLK